MIEDGVKGKEKLSFFNWQSWIRKYLKCASWILLKLYQYNFSGNFSVALSCINKYDVGWIDKKCQNRVNQARIRVLRTLMITEAFVFLWTSLRLMKKYEIKDQKYLSSHTRTWASEKEFKSFICISQLLSDEGRRKFQVFKSDFFDKWISQFQGCVHLFPIKLKWISNAHH